MRRAIWMFVLLATVFGLYAADRLQFNRVRPADLDTIKDETIVLTHGGSQTIPGPAAIASFVASAMAGGSTNGLIVGWDYTEAPGTITFSNATGPTNLGTFTSQGRYTIRVSSTNGAYYNDATFFVFVTDQGITNFLPTVELTSPPNGSTFTSPVNLLLIADAQDKDGSVTNVTFFNGPTAVGTLTNAPWQLVLTNAAATQYVFTAVAWDNRGATNISSSYSVTVNPGVVSAIPPSVTITSPTNGASFVGPVTFALTASATDSDGSIASVILVDNDVTNATVTVPPYSVSITPGQGSHTVKAIATDNTGLQSTDAISFTVTAPAASPVATLTAPSNGASFPSPANVTISATASDSDGTITLVRFFVNGAQVGTDSSSPYSFIVSNLTVGTYALYVQATDNSSGTGTSGTNTITVLAPPGTPPSITLTSPTSNQVFTVGSPVTLAATATDDGSITNVSFYRLTQPTPPEAGDPVAINDENALVSYTGTWLYGPSCSLCFGGNFHYSTETGAGAQLTFTGNRVTWYAAKFSNRGNADVFIDGVLRATIDQYNPTILYQQEMFTTNLVQGEHTIAIVCKGTKSASSSGFYIDVDSFEYASETPGSPGEETFIVSDLVAPYSQTWAAPQGSFTIIAKAWDNSGIVSTSAPPVSITVNPLIPPFVQITSPSEGSTWTNGTAIPLAADATDQDGTVVSVNFRQYIPDADISTDTTSPYTGSWTNAPVGDYAVVAAATDNHGQITFSQAINLHIVSATNTVYVDSGPAQTAQLSVYQPYFDSEYVANSNFFQTVATAGWGQQLYDIQFQIEGTLAMYEATLQTNYIDRVLKWSESIMSTATIIDTDGLKNWRGLYASPHSTTNIAYFLEEVQGFSAILSACRIVLQNPDLRAVWGSRVTTIYNFSRDHVVNKNWFTRNWAAWVGNKFNNTASVGGDKEILMALCLSHSKIISELLSNGDNATYGYPALVSMCANGIKDYNGREARFTAWGGGLVWGKGKIYSSGHDVMDTSHANRIPVVLYGLFKAGAVIDQTIIQGTADLFWKVIWAGTTAEKQPGGASWSNPLFFNYMDGDNSQFLTRPPYENGLIYQGWNWLGEFNTNVFNASAAMLRFIKNGGVNASTRYNNTAYGRMVAAGQLAKVVSVTGKKPYAILNGTVTGSGVTSTVWSRISGPGTATIVKPNSPITTILFGTNAVGVSTFRLTVQSGGPQVSDDVTVNLLAAPAF